MLKIPKIQHFLVTMNMMHIPLKQNLKNLNGEQNNLCMLSLKMRYLKHI